MAQVGILSSAFFMASLIHVPIGPSSVHLLLNGIVGLLLGWGAFPAILVGLALQAMFFQFGGITVLGVNTLNVGRSGRYLLLPVRQLSKKRFRYGPGRGLYLRGIFSPADCPHGRDFPSFY